ncbi:MAG: hypothetical protein L6367_00250 [Cellulomonas sp.]|nr:hypothetical protein [Cellulomonas sp.]
MNLRGRQSHRLHGHRLLRVVLVAALPAAIALAGAPPALARDGLTPVPVGVNDGPTPLVRTADGQWAFEIRLREAGTYIATWERRTGTWSDPQAAASAAIALDECRDGIDDGFFAQFATEADFAAAPGVQVTDGTYAIDDAVRTAWEQQYDTCTAASEWAWERTPSRVDGDDTVVTVPLSVLGPGRHDLFVLGLTTTGTTDYHHWPDGWVGFPTRQTELGETTWFTVYVPEPTTRQAGAQLRAPTVAVGSWSAQSPYSALHPIPFDADGGSGAAATAEPTQTVTASPETSPAAAGPPVPTPTPADPAVAPVRASAPATWFRPVVPPGWGITAGTALVLTLLVAAGSLVTTQVRAAKGRAGATGAGQGSTRDALPPPATPARPAATNRPPDTNGDDDD